MNNSQKNHEIKEEIELEIPKLDLPTKNSQDMVPENVQFFTEIIKKELEKTSSVTLEDIKQEINEYIQPKIESELCEILISPYIYQL